MMSGTVMTVDAEPGEPFGRRLWMLAAAVAMVSAILQAYGINRWPMADDEVLSLVTMGLLDVDRNLFAFPIDHHDKLPRAVPVWHAVQRAALSVLPATEAGVRIPSVIWGVLFAGLAFVLAARWRGLWFAVAIAILVNGNQLFIHVAQVNRFYSLPMLLLAMTVAAMWLPRGGAAMIVMTAGLAVLTIFSHNVTVAFFGLAFVASVATYLLGITPLRVVARSAAACLVTALVYLLYLMPMLRGWYTTGNPTPVLVSYAAYVGIPTVALGLLGVWLVMSRGERDGRAVWWLLLLVGTLLMLVVSTFSWNPRYFVFFLPMFWVPAAMAMDFVARRLNRGFTGAIWYASIIVLLAPNLVSHYADGSRHDYRSAAAVVEREARPDERILSDDAETISYYLPASLRERLSMRRKVRTPPADAFLLVARSNAWMPVPRFADRRVDVLAEISYRRLDQFSHIVRVLRVHPIQSGRPTVLMPERE